MSELKKSLLAAMDFTILKPQVTESETLEFIETANKISPYAICLPSCYITLAKNHLLKSINIATVVGFPLGFSNIEEKVFAARHSIDLGANEIDYVVNISAVKSQNWSLIEDEMKQIKKVCEGDVIVKAIVETAYLSKEEKEKLCHLVKNYSIDFIKTSTGYADSGAQIKDIELFKEILDGKAKIKASGGIRNLEKYREFLNAGADRIGTSSGVSILRELTS